VCVGMHACEKLMHVVDLYFFLGHAHKVGFLALEHCRNGRAGP